jgi:hypothetical protein
MKISIFAGSMTKSLREDEKPKKQIGFEVKEQKTRYGKEVKKRD